MQARSEVDMRLYLLSVLATSTCAQQGSAQHYSCGVPVHGSLAYAASLPAAGQGLPADCARGG